MIVKLISYSQQAIDPSKQDEFEFDLPNLQDLVAYCARACAEVIAKVFPIIKSIREGT